MRRASARLLGTVLFGAALAAATAGAQENYEIEVYPSATTLPGTVMLELHSNYSFQGQRRYVDGVAPTYHAGRETLEASFGLTPWAEAAGYVFTNIQPSLGPNVAGGSARLRVRVPDAWAWPLGLSLSSEVEYARPLYSEDQWTWEIRPIVDTYAGRWYAALNPTLERVWQGVNVPGDVRFAPSAKVSYDVTRLVTAGVEYYASPGEVTGPTRYAGYDTIVVPSGPTGPSLARTTDTDEVLHIPNGTQQLVFAALDVHVSPLWELNVGVGVGTTASTDHFMMKLIVGHAFSLGVPSPFQ